MNKKFTITIDLTKDTEEVFRQIEEASEYLNKPVKKSLWQRIKSWFQTIRTLTWRVRISTYYWGVV